MLKKLPYRHVDSDGDKRGMLPILFQAAAPQVGKGYFYLPRSEHACLQYLLVIGIKQVCLFDYALYLKWRETVHHRHG